MRGETNKAFFARKATMLLIYLAAGGVAGTLARYGIGGWVSSVTGTAFPWATFVVNVVGSFVLGFAPRAMEIAPASAEIRALVTVGFCGAFTTFSTLSFEMFALAQNGAWERAGLYAFGSVGLGLAAVFAGLSVATLIVRLGG